MSQISYKILDHLTQEQSHVRAIAKALHTNPMTVARQLKALEEQNVLDHKEEGRNNVYFIKESLEAQNQLYSMEHQKLSEALSKHPRLRNIVEKIRQDDRIPLAIVFGSYAKDAATKESDIDIYIETQDKNIKKTLAELDSKLSVKTGQFEKKNLLIKEIIKRHIIMKGVERYYALVRQEA